VFGVDLLQDQEEVGDQKEHAILYSPIEPPKLKDLDNRDRPLHHIWIVRDALNHLLPVRLPLFNGPTDLVLIILPTEFCDHSHHLWKGCLRCSIRKLDLEEIDNVATTADTV
jgi:hypothetical protein